ncbi:MAG: hypothetical protein M3619_11815 [Myxococcota bacterium]|nr:hypothetical protein [Myxococcota bacterium]
MSHYETFVSFDGDEDAIAKWAKRLPMRDRLELVSEVYRRTDDGFPEDAVMLVFDSESDTAALKKLRDEGREWAPKFADEVLSMFAAQKTRAPMAVRWPIFLSLVRSRIAIEPRWDALLPVNFGLWTKLTFECVRAIPEDRRAAAIIETCRAEHVYRVQNALLLFSEFPSRDLAAYLVELTKDAEPASKERIVSDLVAAAAHDDDIAALVAALKQNNPKKIVLTCARALKRPTLKKLSPQQQKQLRAAGKRYDGKDLPAAKRLGADRQDEQSFLATLTVCELLDSRGKPAYDAFLYMVDSGTIFKAGTTKVAAEITQGSLACNDEALADALDKALENYRD